MLKEYEEKKPIATNIVSHVSCHGKAFYFYINKDTAEAYGIFPGDKVELQLTRHWKPIMKAQEEETEPKKKKRGKADEEAEA